MAQKMSCAECAFNFDGICVSKNYGDTVEKLFLCEDWKMSIDFYSDLVEKGYDEDEIDIFDFSKEW